MLTVLLVANCRGCDWHTEGPKADTAAAKHTKETGHATATRAELELTRPTPKK